MPLFSNKQEANLRSCIRMVEDALQALGHPPDDSRSESSDDLPAWRVQTSAGARVDVHLGVEDDKNILRVIARLGTVPEGADELPLFRKLLELNAVEVKGVAFGLIGRDVVLMNERTTIDLDPSEVEDLLRRVEQFSTHYAELLAPDLGR